MLSRISHLLITSLLVVIATVSGAAQTADNTSSVIPKPGDSRDDHPKSFRETLVKMRIEQEKKEYQEMLDRGTEVLKLTEELEEAIAERGSFTQREFAKVATVEKLVKKIRGELGGDDDDDKDQGFRRLSPLEAVRTLRQATFGLIDELKKTSRFTISAAAIQSSNAVLRLARFLRISN